MSQVLCGVEDCRYINGEICTACMIELGDDGICMSVENYLDNAEYQVEYYIAVKAFDGKQGRARKSGKEIVINGEIFYTKDSPCSDEEHTYVTHSRTGYLCGTVKDVKEHFDEFMRRQSHVKDVNCLPLVEFDDMKRRYFYVDEQIDVDFSFGDYNKMDR